MSGEEIESRVRNGSLALTPFERVCLNGGGYDLRLGMEVIIPPGENRLVATLERVELGDDIAGTLHLRSSLARKGIIASLALVDPGFHGQLTISLFNGGEELFKMSRNGKFVQLVLHELSSKTNFMYSGKYQDSQGIVDSRP
ncbi:MAG: dCTP deaminase [Candidatus Bathyarchaeia archaeon]